MHPSFMQLLHCPACASPLREAADTSLTCDCGRTFPVRVGVPDLVYPEHLLPSDVDARDQYDSVAEFYDDYAEWVCRTTNSNQAALRATLADRLELKPGDRVLEISCGTGLDLPPVVEKVGDHGTVAAIDLSAEMLRIASSRMAGLRPTVHFARCNAAYLPFADGAFDALLHFGGLNTFGELERSLAEMTRVVRVGGKVVIGDEGIAPWLLQTAYGRTIVRNDPLYRLQPPLAALPAHAQEVQLSWLLGNSFYLLEYRVGSQAPQLDLDLKIPGRNKTLRDVAAA
jgi:ubiquinone/menaquinone biosynthesis C-methylase UbiE